MKKVIHYAVHQYIYWTSWKKSAILLGTINLFIILRIIGYSMTFLILSFFLVMWAGVLFVNIFYEYKPSFGENLEIISKDALEAPLFLCIACAQYVLSTIIEFAHLKNVKKLAISAPSIYVLALLSNCMRCALPLIGIQFTSY